MPGPGPHTMYTIGFGVGLMSLSEGRFSPQHCIIYATNAFLGPDLGSFSEWLTSTIGFGHNLGSLIMDTIHHPFYYILILGFPLSFFYSWISRIFLQKGILDSISGVPLNRLQCLLLVSAGSISHFFLDHLFEENGHSSMYTWIMSTGWWKGRAPVNTDSVVVVGSLCTCLFGGFIYINRVKQSKSFRTQWVQSVKLILVIASLYCVWCASQLYLRNPPQPAVGEEADLGVIVFLAIYLFLPHSLCIMSMNPKDNHLDTTELPL
ncbi:hypothetical protein C5167_032961 [Papaver somniferum]|uniref:Uncharacterized protein n=1 Tax=Papaver somniferum TaxID=3469 RepID=A0A4Y7K8Z7_PAPSO|nr:uncharacterized protein LOC113297919 [Papaver somniferum]RZC69824.1 hypothetical protein C5167_032961 [Papaver somniferum]